MARRLLYIQSVDNMKLAISVYGDQISPRFDCAQSILIVSFENEAESVRYSISTIGMNGIQQMKSISAERCTTIICGAMPGFFHRMAQAAGLYVVFASGAVEEIIESIKKGGIQTVNAAGFRGHGCGFGHGRGNRCGTGNNRNGLRHTNERQQYDTQKWD